MFHLIAECWDGAYTKHRQRLLLAWYNVRRPTIIFMLQNLGLLYEAVK